MSLTNESKTFKEFLIQEDKSFRRTKLSQTDMAEIDVFRKLESLSSIFDDSKFNKVQNNTSLSDIVNMVKISSTDKKTILNKSNEDVHLSFFRMNGKDIGGVTFSIQLDGWSDDQDDGGSNESKFTKEISAPFRNYGSARLFLSKAMKS